ncbi:MAG: CPBP family intramembrane metalloprotease [Bacteroidetes bacterium]|nr:CPBP family intramembrane metalloprotease [Fibrella sp.]
MLTGFVLLGGSLITVLFFFALAVLRGTDAAETQNYIQTLLTDPKAGRAGWYDLITLQGASSIGTFILPCLLYWYAVEHKPLSAFNVRPLSAVRALGAVVVLVIAFMPVDGLFIEWNQNLDLPASLEPLERWMRDTEDRAAVATKTLTTFATIGQLLTALLVIALLPAIGEELLFRGILQRKLVTLTGGVHAGIWLTAVLFSAIHVQFYGFVPRMLLGALFGYLYAWSGNLWVPMLAHFVNNGFTVLMVYFYQQKQISVDIESTDSVPWYGALASLIATVLLMAYFRRENQLNAPLNR